MAQVMLSVGAKGDFKRPPSVYRNWISRDVGALFPPAKGRYLLYVSYACPWACRALSFRQLKGLEDAIDIAVVHPVFRLTKPGVDDHEGWVFDTSFDAACTSDPIFGAQTLREVYERALPPGETLTTRFTVPVLFDKESKRIVNNESSDIIRMLNDEFNDFATHSQVDLAPLALRPRIDAVNESIYETVNNGVYKCGFAQSQEAYNEAVTALFDRLEKLDQELDHSRFLVGDQITESDVRLFVCLVRFDEVYVVHFKCAKKAIREFKNLPLWLRDVFQTAKLAPTVNMQHIRNHYYRSHRSINRYGIVPISVEFDLNAPHGRAERKYAA